MRIITWIVLTLALVGCTDGPTPDATIAEVRGRLVKVDAELKAAEAMPTGTAKVEALEEQHARLTEAVALLESAAKSPVKGERAAELTEVTKAVGARLAALKWEIAQARIDVVSRAVPVATKKD